MAPTADTSAADALDRELSDDATGEPQRAIVLPDTAHAKVSPAEALKREFAEAIAADVVERTVAAARHALERSHLLATPEAIERLARERLRSRLGRSVSHIRSSAGISARPRR